MSPKSRYLALKKVQNLSDFQLMRHSPGRGLAKLFPVERRLTQVVCLWWNVF